MLSKDKYYQINKIVINIGMGEGVKDKNLIEAASKDLMAITGQKPSFRKARKAISAFKIRQGDVIGLTVTLRGKRMKDFLTKLINIVLPKIRDFQGVPLTGFDGHGNYNFGISEQIVFPEVDYTKVSRITGLQITLVINNGNDEKSLQLLKTLGMPFEKPRGKSFEKEIKNG